MVGFSTSREALNNSTEIAQVDDAKDPQGAQKILSRAAQNDRVWPVVHFPNERTMLITSVDFTVNNAQGGVEASREQVSGINASQGILFIACPDSSHPCVGIERA